MSRSASPALEWSRMTSREQDPFFVPRPTGGVASAYDTEKFRRHLPCLNMERQVGRDAFDEELPEVEPQKKARTAELQYGMSKQELEKIKRREKKRYFMSEGAEYLRSQGLFKKVPGVADMQHSTSRDQAPLHDKSNRSGSLGAALSPDFDHNRHISGGTFPKSDRVDIFRRRSVHEGPGAPSVADAGPAPLDDDGPKGFTGAAHPLLVKEIGTFGSAPARPVIKTDNRSELEVNYEVVKHRLTTTVDFNRSASRLAGDPSMKPSMAYKKLFQRYQRPHQDFSVKLRQTGGRATFSSIPPRHDLEGLLRQADNDCRRAASSLANHETSEKCKSVIFRQ